MGFAEGTTVPVEKSRAEIERLVAKYGASEFSSGWSGPKAALQFMAHGRRVRFVLDLPTVDWAKRRLMSRKHSRWWDRSQIPESATTPLVQAEERRRWRCLLLAIKAKLEVVESGIATFEEEFLAHIVVDNMTIYDRIKQAAANGKPMLPPIE